MLVLGYVSIGFVGISYLSTWLCWYLVMLVLGYVGIGYLSTWFH